MLHNDLEKLRTQAIFRNLEEDLSQADNIFSEIDEDRELILRLIDKLRQDNVALLVIVMPSIIKHVLANKELLLDILKKLSDLPIAFRALDLTMVVSLLSLISDQNSLPEIMYKLSNDTLSKISKTQWAEIFINATKQLPTVKYIGLINTLSIRCPIVIPQMFEAFKQHAIYFAKRTPQDLYDVLATFANYKNLHRLNIDDFFERHFLKNYKEKYPLNYEYFLKHLLKDTKFYPVDLKKVARWEKRVGGDHDILLLQSLLCEYLQFNFSFFNNGFKRHYRNEIREILEKLAKDTLVDNCIDELALHLSKPHAHVINPMGDLRALLYVIKSTKQHPEVLPHMHRNCIKYP